jgi:hypothetical protein
LGWQIVKAVPFVSPQSAERLVCTRTIEASCAVFGFWKAYRESFCYLLVLHHDLKVFPIMWWRPEYQPVARVSIDEVTIGCGAQWKELD